MELGDGLVGGAGIAMVGVVDESKIQRLEAAGAASKGQARWAWCRATRPKGQTQDGNEGRAVRRPKCAAWQFPALQAAVT